MRLLASVKRQRGSTFSSTSRSLPFCFYNATTVHILQVSDRTACCTFSSSTFNIPAESSRSGPTARVHVIANDNKYRFIFCTAGQWSGGRFDEPIKKWGGPHTHLLGGSILRLLLGVSSLQRVSSVGPEMRTQIMTQSAPMQKKYQIPNGGRDEQVCV